MPSRATATLPALQHAPAPKRPVAQAPKRPVAQAPQRPGAHAPQRPSAPAPTRRCPAERASARQQLRHWDHDIREAVALGHFTLNYQPRICLTHGRPLSAEALLRWPHRKRGMVPPAEFIPIAERNGQISDIGAWVLRTACLQAAQWTSGQGISVNVSARQLREGVLPAQVAAALEESGLNPERLELELTESMLIDIDIETLLTLSAIRDLGVGLALDDFGTGYGSLAMLKHLPLTVMKLDRSLVHELPHVRGDAAIARAVVATGHALGLVVVGEGIETEAQRAFLGSIGCDEGQGYLFSQPVPAARLGFSGEGITAPQSAMV